MNNLYNIVKVAGADSESMLAFCSEEAFPTVVDSLIVFPIPHGQTLVEALHAVRPAQPVGGEV